MGAVITASELELDPAFNEVTPRTGFSLSGETVWKLRTIRKDLKTEIVGDAVEDGDYLRLARDPSGGAGL